MKAESKHETEVISQLFIINEYTFFILRASTSRIVKRNKYETVESVKQV